MIHTFVSNVGNIEELETLITRSSCESTIDVSKPIIADLFWYHINCPISNICYCESKINTIIEGWDNIKSYLADQLDY